jgi:hypothetical protein
MWSALRSARSLRPTGVSPDPPSAIRATEAAATRSMRVAPVLRRLGVDLQRHRELQKGMRRVGNGEQREKALEGNEPFDVSCK